VRITVAAAGEIEGAIGQATEAGDGEARQLHFEALSSQVRKSRPTY
jgi:hypothetical protein